MNAFQALFLGLIQGLTEFLPISSSGHLIFIPKIFHWADQGLAFDAVVHLGTLVAVIIYFRERLLLMLKSLLVKNINKNSELNFNRHLFFFLVITVIPSGFAGLFFNDFIENNLRSSLVIGSSLIFFGLILYIAEVYGKKNIDLNKINFKKVLFISFSEMLALIPGVSRSGITMSAGLFCNLNKKTAAEFSFLMSIPIIFLAGSFAILKLFKIGIIDVGLLELFIGFVSSVFGGWLSIYSLMKIVKRFSFKPFVIYRIVVGLLILLFLI